MSVYQEGTIIIQLVTELQDTLNKNGKKQKNHKDFDIPLLVPERTTEFIKK